MRGLFVISLCLQLLPVLAQKYELDNAPMNGSGNDFHVVMGDDSIAYFVSDRALKTLVTYQDQQGNPPSNIYIFDPQSKQSKPLPGTVNSIANEGPFCFSNDGTELFFTGTIKGKPSVLGIFRAKKSNGLWGDVQALPFNATDGSYSSAHPSLSSDGKRLFFSSDRPGSMGGKDIFFVEKSGNGWSEPINLGDAINSLEDELFPFVHDNGRLYFSSNRQEEREDLDIYMADLNLAKPTVINLGDEINSRANDYSWWSDARDESGYISSDRKGYSNIYSFEFIYPDFEECVENRPADLCYEITESEIVHSDTLPFKYEWDYGDGTTSGGLSNIHCFPGPGTYNIHLNIFDTITNTVFGRVSEYTLVIESPNSAVIEWEDLMIENELEIQVDTQYLEDFIAMEYYWRGNGEPIARKEIIAIPNPTENYNIQIGLIGQNSAGEKTMHCTYAQIYREEVELIAQETGNEIDSLSQGQTVEDQVAEKVSKLEESDEELRYFVEFLVSEVPVAEDDTIFKDIEYPITERRDEQDDYRYSVGMTDNPLELYPVLTEMRKIGFDQSIVLDESIAHFTESISSGGVFNEESTREEITEHLNEFNDILFPVNSATIEQTSLQSLDYVAWAMNHRDDIQLNIIAHTDNSGSPEYNMQLSKERAASVRNYLMKKGIAVDRLNSEGKGETQPVADNATEEGRAKNRRVEFEIDLLVDGK